MPYQAHYRPSVFNAQEELIVRQEIKTILAKGVIYQSHHEPGEFISTIFLRPKSDGSFRMILSLKEFNKSVEHHHFKMDNLDTVTKMIKPGCYMASVDLKPMSTAKCLYTKTNKTFCNLNLRVAFTKILASLMASRVLHAFLQSCLSQFIQHCTIRAI